jgi:hypothetical protein
MVNIVGEKTSDTSKIIIESTSIPYSLWGELLAQRLDAKHFVYLLHSHFEDLKVPYLEYANFKYERKELAGMVAQTLPLLFAGYRNIDEHERYHLRAAGKNPISSSPDSNAITNEIFKAKDCDYVIGGFGTLNKPHALDIFKEVKKFAYKHSDKKIAYIVIGSSFTGAIESKMLEMSKGCENLHLILAGEMFPVPERLFKAMDVCIGSWGSATVAARAGAKTIRLSNDTQVIPQGLIGYTLTKEPYSDYKCYAGTLIEVIEDVLVRGKYNNMEYMPPSLYPDYHEEHKKHMDFIEQSCQIREYYDINKIKPQNIKQYIKKYLIMGLGIKRADYCFNIFRKILNK